MDDIFGQGDLGSVEHTRLVHVVPGVGVESRANILVQGVLLGEILSSLWVQEIGVQTVIKKSR